MIRILIGIIGIIWFMLPVMTYGMLNIGNATGIAVSLFILLWGKYHEAIRGFVKKRKAVTVAAAVIIAAICGTAAVETVCMARAVANRSTDGNRTLVVLGCKVIGENPSLMLYERLESALEYLNENPDASCVVSGGQGEDEEISEAECMYRFLVQNGISEDRLYMEDKSSSTRENIEFTKKIIKDNSLEERIAIVTNEFHEYRAGKIAEKLDMDYRAVPARTAWWLFPTYYVRELYGILFEWIF